MRTLLQVSGHQLLVDGTFNADPHAGNFLLLPDGKLGLIDMGQVKRLSDSERIEICKYLAVLGEKGVSTALRKQRVATLGLQHGYQSRDLNPDVMYNMVRFGLDKDGPEVTGGRNVQQFMDEQYARDPWSKTDDMLRHRGKVRGDGEGGPYGRPRLDAAGGQEAPGRAGHARGRGIQPREPKTTAHPVPRGTQARGTYARRRVQNTHICNAMHTYIRIHRQKHDLNPSPFFSSSDDDDDG